MYRSSHHQNDSCFKTGSDESHFNVPLIVRDKVTKQCPQTTTVLKRRVRAEAESSRGPSAYQPNALPLGQTGSPAEVLAGTKIKGGGGGEGELYLTLHCHHQKDFCGKMGSDQRHFNVSLTVRCKVTRRCPQTTTSLLITCVTFY